METPRPNLAYLLSLSGPNETVEHAEYARARVEHGYCTDDVARALLFSVCRTNASMNVTKLATFS